MLQKVTQQKINKTDSEEKILLKEFILKTMLLVLLVTQVQNYSITLKNTG